MPHGLSNLVDGEAGEGGEKHGADPGINIACGDGGNNRVDKHFGNQERGVDKGSSDGVN